MKTDGATDDTLATMALAGIGIGCLLAGVAVGASARLRVAIASLIGGAAGIVGFFALIVAQAEHGHDNDPVAGMAIIVVGGGIVTMIGSALGWTAIGKRTA